ncbi:hypothetical protein [Lacticaseibacillus saniviri]|uniref:hypothetical protein n=1 Tax=Lacticaseibacillus saniviri TaxID=931533 RepID=UPI0006CF5CD7|nr:hypothetical protein [Lacticaseibacillus saniviri]
MTEEKHLNEIDKKEAFLRNKKNGYHATVYLDPNNNIRRDTSNALFRVMPTRKCKAREGDPLARVFKGARLLEVFVDFDKEAISQYGRID